MRRGLSAFNITALALGLAFLYLPIVILVMYSFNACRRSRSGAAGHSLVPRCSRQRDAGSGLGQPPHRASVGDGGDHPRHIRRGRAGAHRPFPWALGFSAGMIYAPLVLPEVIIGLALLLLFVAVDFDRGFWTTALAHATLTMCFVAAIVQARLMDFDRWIEEAAMDLGCPPLRTFLTVTLPLILPAIASGWMLAFTLSLDDFVIASFTTGPGATTLPIRIYSEVRLGVKPETNAICTLMIASVALMVVAASLLSKRCRALASEQGAARCAGVSSTGRCAAPAGRNRKTMNHTGTITSAPSSTFGSAQSSAGAPFQRLAPA